MIWAHQTESGAHPLVNMHIQSSDENCTTNFHKPVSERIHLQTLVIYKLGLN